MTNTKVPLSHGENSLFSLAGHRVNNNANMHFYCASKHATTVLSEGLRNELNALEKKFRVTVSAVKKNKVSETYFNEHALKSFCSRTYQSLLASFSKFAFWKSIAANQPWSGANSILARDVRREVVRRFSGTHFCLILWQAELRALFSCFARRSPHRSTLFSTGSPISENETIFCKKFFSCDKPTLKGAI